MLILVECMTLWGETDGKEYDSTHNGNVQISDYTSRLLSVAGELS